MNNNFENPKKKRNPIIIIVLVIIAAWVIYVATNKNNSEDNNMVEKSDEQMTKDFANEKESPVIDNVTYEFTNNQERIYELSFGKIYWATLIEIENTGNVPIYLGSTNYDLTDNNDKIIKTGNLSSFPDILYSGEKGYFYDKVELTEVKSDISINFTPRWNIKKSKEDRINFDLSEIEIREDQYGTTVFGKIANNTDKEREWAIISVILYANDGTPIGVWMTNITETMPIGSNFGFEISGILNRTLYDKITPDMVDHYTAYAYPPQYQY